MPTFGSRSTCREKSGRQSQRRRSIELMMAREPVFGPNTRRFVKLRAAEPKFVTTMVVSEHKGSPRADPHPPGRRLHAQGRSRRPGRAARLARLANQSPGTPPDRLDLARWLVDRRNPLTARVVVNRIWQVYFGRGLVETDNDFGTQGSYPSHPELLDWLACELMDCDWNEKRDPPADRELGDVSRRPRATGSDAQAIDPDNRLLWRQSRLRLDAELIRDAALQCSGLLDDQDRRPERLPAAARWGDDPRPDEAALGGGRRPEPLSSRTLHLLLAGDAASVPDDVRRSRRRAVVHAAIAIQHAAPGADASERPGLFRDRPGTGRAHPCRTAGPRHRSRSARARVSALPGPPGVRQRAQDARERARAGACGAEFSKTSRVSRHKPTADSVSRRPQSRG